MSPSTSRGERLLLVLTPAVAMAAVALGLRVGARDGIRAAIVFGAPPASDGQHVAWSIVVFDETRGAREAAPDVPVDVIARTGATPASASASATASWNGVTNVDGVAEAPLALPMAWPSRVELEVRSGGTRLAQGTVETFGPAPVPGREFGPGPAPGPGAAAGLAPSAHPPVWLPFARREGAIVLDVALLGGRAAPGFPAQLWIRATDASTHAPLPRVTVTPEDDTSLTAPQSAGTTDARGWARVVVTPVGLAVTPTLQARSPDGRAGTWIGGLYMSPGAPAIETRPRWDPGAPILLEVTMPTVRSTAYVEIDDAHGRAWAAAVALEARPDGTSHANVIAASALAPGLFWAIASAGAPVGAFASGSGARDEAALTAGLASGAIATPFFIAPRSEADEAALAFGTDADTCVPSRDPRDAPDALGACLALAPIEPAPRWSALDGFVAQRQLDREARTQGLAIALGALAVAIALEGVLLMRIARGTRARTAAVAILVGLLGFALLAAFIARV